MYSKKIPTQSSVYVVLCGMISILLLHASFASAGDEKKELIKRTTNASNHISGTQLAVIAGYLANFGTTAPSFSHVLQGAKQYCLDCAQCVGKTGTACCYCCCTCCREACCECLYLYTPISYDNAHIRDKKTSELSQLCLIL